MNFGISQTIQNLSGDIFRQSLHNYSSKPSETIINPGLNINLNRDVVPVNPLSNLTTIQRLAKNSKSDQNEKNNDIASANDKDNQSGSGFDQDVIEHSFEHPQRIKTETVELLKVKPAIKRKSDDSSSARLYKKKPLKFQLI